MSDRWKRQRELFDAASRLPQEKRHAFLEQACADDSALIGSIEALLAEHDEDGDSISPTIRDALKSARLWRAGPPLSPWARGPLSTSVRARSTSAARTSSPIG